MTTYPELFRNGPNTFGIQARTYSLKARMTSPLSELTLSRLNIPGLKDCFCHKDVTDGRCCRGVAKHLVNGKPNGKERGQ